MKSTFKVMTVREIIDLAISGKLNPDPIAQRPPTASGPKKSIGITTALWVGYGVGLITVRDIRNDAEMQKIYPGIDFNVIDGGHRVRAMVDFYTNRFKVMDNFFKEIETEQQKNFLNTEVAMEFIVCTSEETIQIFRNRNKTTDVNFMEMIMCDDQSVICREIRSLVKYYKEYKNTVHPLFSVSRNQGGEWKSNCFDTEINKRRKWDEYIFIAMLKAIGGGNVDAGQREIEQLIADEYEGNMRMTKSVMATVNQFLDDVVNFQKTRGKKLNEHIFAALQLVWFALFEKNRKFKIDNHYVFMIEFMETYSKLTGTSNTEYNNKIVDISKYVDGAQEQELVNLKEFVRTNTKNFSNSEVQRICAKIFLEEMGENIGVVFRDGKRSLTSAEREEYLAIQKYRCAIDDEPLTLADSVWGHDTPWAKGGRLSDGAVIRKSHNVDMGSITIEEYRLILELRRNKAA